MLVCELDLYYRIKDELKRAGITYVHELCNLTEKELAEILSPGKREKDLALIKAQLSEHGLSLYPEFPVKNPATEKLFTHNTRVYKLNISPYTNGGLIRAHICTIGELCSKTEEELLKLPLLGKVRVEEIKKALATHGFELKAAPPKEDLKKKTQEMEAQAIRNRIMVKNDEIRGIMPDILSEIEKIENLSERTEQLAKVENAVNRLYIQLVKIGESCNAPN